MSISYLSITLRDKREAAITGKYITATEGTIFACLYAGGRLCICLAGMGQAIA
ncbi:hypothetical protein [Legionella septentrionalis]|uniref:hypothetical protein n=1 Tax=Legionella septentrionalis TaxID=2498109 RepID=UPI0013155420|nr:hypothetical protein [Legionella septentrionalis]